MNRLPRPARPSVERFPLAILPDVVRASDPLERLTYRLGEVASLLGVSRRTLERERSAGRFPKPDLAIGKAPLWTRETLAHWIAEGGGQC
jgi:predicted DNA-binding transcriptional regulator AlpA